jgi:hypothetical protein
MLHITNGDSAGETLGLSGVPGAWLAWKDILHEGPVPTGLSLAALSDVRAHFIADQRWGNDYDSVLADFRVRDATLAAYSLHDEIVMWFEHDLYDQLQLLQLLDWFRGHELGTTRLSLICIGSYPGRSRFLGLGELAAAEMATLFPTRHYVTPEELSLGHTAWSAFCAPDPTALEVVLAGDTSALPYLRPALQRHLEEFPSTQDGLSRTQRELLEVIQTGHETPLTIFRAWQAIEEAPYMGDTSLWAHLQDLGEGPDPLVTLTNGGGHRLPNEAHEALSTGQFAAQHFALTDTGQAVLARQADHLTLNGIDRWLGGVWLHPGAPLWRWQPEHQHLVIHRWTDGTQGRE